MIPSDNTLRTFADVANMSWTTANQNSGNTLKRSMMKILSETRPEWEGMTSKNSIFKYQITGPKNSTIRVNQMPFSATRGKRASQICFTILI
jgi:hypothetical protein